MAECKQSEQALHLKPMEGKESWRYEEETRIKDRFFRLSGAADRMQSDFKLRLDDRFFFVSNGYNIHRTQNFVPENKFVQMVGPPESSVPGVADSNAQMTNGEKHMMQFVAGNLLPDHRDFGGKMSSRHQ